MKKINLVLIILSAIIISCGGPPNTSSGEELFKTHCISCHQSQETKLEFNTWKSAKDRASIISYIGSGKEAQGMPSFENTLSAEQIQDIADFVINRLNITLDSLMAQRENSHEFYETMKGRIKVEQIIGKEQLRGIKDFKVIWGMTWLDPFNMLLTLRSGALYRYDYLADSLIEIKGIPEVVAISQGGLLDVEAHPKFHENNWIYLTYSSGSKLLSATTVARYKFNNDSLQMDKIILESSPKHFVAVEYGSRIDFDTDSTFYVSIGDRTRDALCQELDNDLGKVHRFKDDGRIPKDNPFKNDNEGVSSIYSYGHRNIQGVAYDEENKKLYTVEHGPRGGDELNLIVKGANYGWPLATYGTNYDGSIISDSTHIKGTLQPLIYWVPSIAPGGLEFVSSEKFPQWKGDLLVTGLRAKNIFRLSLGKDGVHEEPLFEVFGRLRDIQQAPDGYIYFSVERYESTGEIYRISPADTI